MGSSAGVWGVSLRNARPVSSARQRCLGGGTFTAVMTLTKTVGLGTILLIPLCSVIGAGPARAQSDHGEDGSALAHYRLGGAPSRRLKLASELAEISGIGFTSDGRLLGHGDERGTIWQIDPATGEVVKRFGFGSHGHLLRGDFEDIQVVGQRIFLVTSAGKIFEGREAANGVV